jgi:hypothetical protein
VEGTLTVSTPAHPEPVELVLTPSPAYQALDGDQLASRTGQVCFDRLGIGLTNTCTFWRGRERRCKYCSIGLNTGVEDRSKSLEAIRHTVRLALSDPVYPARHVLLGGGTPRRPDAGATDLAAAARVVREIDADVAIYVMLAAPDDPAVLSDLANAGVDEIGINLELYDDAAAAYYLPAKRAHQPRAHVLRALERVVELIGPVNTRSIMVAGLESRGATMDGVRALAERGVMPILSPLRPLVGTPLEDESPPTPASMAELAQAAQAVADEFDIPIGPTCRACQGNTINPVDHPSYRRY